MPNRLAQETSPYLQQHAENPVDWYPWGEEALARSKRENRPILLSVGYSACHWCHVMAHESFEDPETAAVMNELFVNVKVDREERPDLDQIYQLAHALLTQRNGGWPLTMFLTPDQVPFFGGTYFPKTARFGLPGFKDLLPQVAAAWRTHQADIARQNESLLDALARSAVTAPTRAVELGDGPIGAVVSGLQSHFDGVEGGLGDAPKFPHPVELGFLLRRGALDGDDEARHMALLTLRKMAGGGLYDQVGGGFARYSVDRTWTIPHFEKMLYDNGPLLRLYAEAWALTREPLFERVARETAAWVMREMQSPAGGYYSTLDADSEHEEGKFYVWTPDEVRPLLTADEYAVAAAHWGLDGPPNFEGHFWHLRVVKPLAGVAAALGKPLADCEALLASARAKLFAAREVRVRPGRDEKILASWNGLMIAGMARAGRAFGEAAWIDSAERAVGFVRGTLWNDGRLLATCKDGKAHLNAYLDDHAFLLEGLLELLQARFRPEHLAFARELAEALLARFEDRDAGGFYFTSHDHEPLIQRPKPGHDNATPSGNGVAAIALLRLGHLLGEPRFTTAAERTLRLFYPQMTRQASGFTSLAVALEEWLRPPTVAVLRGPAERTAAWAAALGGEFMPGTLVLDTGIRADLPPALDKPVTGDVNAWVCSGVTCLPAITELEETVRACKSRPVV